ncbi:MAG TPA: hypothetical protein VHZ03_35285 [Trebonia sp.]|nr:hypothetical protein [Trebonia sp.]
MVPGPPAAGLTGKAAPDHPGQQFGLARILPSGEEKSRIPGEPDTGIGHGQIEVEQLSR